MNILLLFVLIIILLLLLTRSRCPFRKYLAQAEPGKGNLQSFLKNKTSTSKGKKYIYADELVVSSKWKFRGRFDFVILGVDKLKTLDAVVEFKFPQSSLPFSGRDEDFFQAGLYALALMESGLSCKKTILIVIYCLQSHANRCKKRELQNCFCCCHGKIFGRKFRPTRLIKTLEHMRAYWERRRPPFPSPEKGKCRRCPYSRGICRYSA